MEKERRIRLFKRENNPNTTQYYETAANLGDTGKSMHAISGDDIRGNVCKTLTRGFLDAMNDAAWCFEHGFGGKKDKVSSRSRFLSPFRCRNECVIPCRTMGRVLGGNVFQSVERPGKRQSLLLDTSGQSFGENLVGYLRQL